MQVGNPSSFDKGCSSFGHCKPMVQQRDHEAGQQTGEGGVARGAFPEHPQENNCEQRCIDHGEDRLQEIHDVSEQAGQVSCRDAHDNPENGGHPANFKIVLRITFLIVSHRANVALINIIGPHGVERRDVACHARHERGQQGSDAQAEHTGGEILFQQRDDRIVVVVMARGNFRKRKP